MKTVAADSLDLILFYESFSDGVRNREIFKRRFAKVGLSKLEFCVAFLLSIRVE